MSDPYELHCPECGEKADAIEPFFVRYSMTSLTLKIFVCSPCRTIYIDKPTIRKIISKWRKKGVITREMPYESLYREFLKELENLVDSHFVPTLGYKKIHFLKRPQKTKP